MAIKPSDLPYLYNSLEILSQLFGEMFVVKGMSNTDPSNTGMMNGATTLIDPDDRKIAAQVFSDCVGVLRTDGEFRLIAVKQIAAGTRLFTINGDITQRPTR